MPPLAVALVLVAAVTHAVWNLNAKRASNGGAVFVWLTATAGTILYLPVAAVAFVLTPPDWNPLVPLAVVGSALIHVAYFVLLQRGYADGDLTVVYPLARGTGPALSVLAAVIVFHERPGLVGVLGAAAVVAGILVIGFGRGGGKGGRLGAGIGHGLLIGVTIACYTLWDAWAVGPLAISPLVFDWSANLVRAAVLTPYALRRRPEIGRVWRDHRGPVLTVAVLSSLAYILVLFAYRLGAPVSFVAPAREFSIVVAGFLGWLLLRERDASRRIIGAIVVLGGVIALALART